MQFSSKCFVEKLPLKNLVLNFKKGKYFFGTLGQVRLGYIKYSALNVFLKIWLHLIFKYTFNFGGRGLLGRHFRGNNQLRFQEYYHPCFTKRSLKTLTLGYKFPCIENFYTCTTPKTYFTLQFHLEKIHILQFVIEHFKFLEKSFY